MTAERGKGVFRAGWSKYLPLFSALPRVKVLDSRLRGNDDLFGGSMALKLSSILPIGNNILPHPKNMSF
ncbi:MAG: hypothetical protein WDO70_07760 [Alphaproteobacteria bacterium]